MTENLQTVTLKCPSCGGSLNISKHMERFACSYCGTEQMVVRQGGTISIRPLEDAVKRVQLGTDKTAAELALIRLDKDRAELEIEWKELEAGFNRQQEIGGAASGSPSFYCCCVSCLGLLGSSCSRLAESQGPSGSAWQ